MTILLSSTSNYKSCFTCYVKPKPIGTMFCARETAPDTGSFVANEAEVGSATTSWARSWDWLCAIFSK